MARKRRSINWILLLWIIFIIPKSLGMWDALHNKANVESSPFSLSFDKLFPKPDKSELLETQSSNVVHSTPRSFSELFTPPMVLVKKKSHAREAIERATRRPMAEIFHMVDDKDEAKKKIVIDEENGIVTVTTEKSDTTQRTTQKDFDSRKKVVLDLKTSGTKKFIPRQLNKEDKANTMSFVTPLPKKKVIYLGGPTPHPKVNKVTIGNEIISDRSYSYPPPPPTVPKLEYPERKRKTTPKPKSIPVSYQTFKDMKTRTVRPTSQYITEVDEDEYNEDFTKPESGYSTPSYQVPKMKANNRLPIENLFDEKRAPNTGYNGPNTRYSDPKQEAPNTGYSVSETQAPSTGYNEQNEQAPSTRYNAPSHRTPNPDYNQPDQKPPSTVYSGPEGNANIIPMTTMKNQPYIPMVVMVANPNYMPSGSSQMNPQRPIETSYSNSEIETTTPAYNPPKPKATPKPSYQSTQSTYNNVENVNTPPTTYQTTENETPTTSYAVPTQNTFTPQPQPTYNTNIPTKSNGVTYSGPNNPQPTNNPTIPTKSNGVTYSGPNNPTIPTKSIESTYSGPNPQPTYNPNKIPTKSSDSTYSGPKFDPTLSYQAPTLTTESEDSAFHSVSSEGVESQIPNVGVTGRNPFLTTKPNSNTEDSYGIPEGGIITTSRPMQTTNNGQTFVVKRPKSSAQSPVTPGIPLRPRGTMTTRPRGTMTTRPNVFSVNKTFDSSGTFETKIMESEKDSQIPAGGMEQSISLNINVVVNGENESTTSPRGNNGAPNTINTFTSTNSRPSNGVTTTSNGLPAYGNRARSPSPAPAARPVTSNPNRPQPGNAYQAPTLPTPSSYQAPNIANTASTNSYQSPNINNNPLPNSYRGPNSSNSNQSPSSYQSPNTETTPSSNTYQAPNTPNSYQAPVQSTTTSAPTVYQTPTPATTTQSPMIVSTYRATVDSNEVSKPISTSYQTVTLKPNSKRPKGVTKRRRKKKKQRRWRKKKKPSLTFEDGLTPFTTTTFHSPEDVHYQVTHSYESVEPVFYDDPELSYVSPEPFYDSPKPVYESYESPRPSYKSRSPTPPPVHFSTTTVVPPFTSYGSSIWHPEPKETPSYGTTPKPIVPHSTFEPDYYEEPQSDYAKTPKVSPSDFMKELTNAIRTPDQDYYIETPDKDYYPSAPEKDYYYEAPEIVPNVKEPLDYEYAYEYDQADIYSLYTYEDDYYSENDRTTHPDRRGTTIDYTRPRTTRSPRVTPTPTSFSKLISKPHANTILTPTPKRPIVRTTRAPRIPTPTPTKFSHLISKSPPEPKRQTLRPTRAPFRHRKPTPTSFSKLISKTTSKPYLHSPTPKPRTIPYSSTLKPSRPKRRRRPKPRPRTPYVPNQPSFFEINRDLIPDLEQVAKSDDWDVRDFRSWKEEFDKYQTANYPHSSANYPPSHYPKPRSNYPIQREFIDSEVKIPHMRNPFAQQIPQIGLVHREIEKVKTFDELIRYDKPARHLPYEITTKASDRHDQNGNDLHLVEVKPKVRYEVEQLPKFEIDFKEWLAKAGVESIDKTKFERELFPPKKRKRKRRDLHDNYIQAFVKSLSNISQLISIAQSGQK